ncbi:MAG TPA: hypothetical protein VML75_09175, partial [Kofleriaceae bacterium]|nr:hypothetical protein [Kofleriaceae bacterium]
FVPIVDQLLYAPQTMFASAYFGGVVDDEVLRDRADRFNHLRPRGKLYYEKLRDLLGPPALTRFIDLVIAGEVPYRQAAEAAYGGSLEWFFRQWSRPYPRVNYKLLDRTSTASKGGRWDSTVTVARETAAADEAPVEPVEIQVILTNGKERLMRWDGAGPQATLRFQAEAPIRRVIVDPRGRLLETDLDGGDEHALFDNRDKHELRFVYNSFGLLLNLTDLSALLAVDFTLARVNDPKNEMRFTAWRSESVRAGVFTEYRHAFGPALDPDTLMSRVAIHAGLRRLDGEFFSGGSGEGRAATALMVGGEVRSDDRVFYFHPMRVRALAFGADLTLTRRDTLQLGSGADVLVSGLASVRYTNVWTPRAGHTLAFNTGAHIALGDLQHRSQLVSSGGLTGLRGYAPSELFSRARLMARAEYRHWYRHDLSWNLGHYNHVRGVGGALFADAALLAPCDSYDLARADAVHASVGYGLQFSYDSFGTLPFLMRVDVAVPLVRRQRTCLSDQPEDFPPVMAYISFEPPF